MKFETTSVVGAYLVHLDLRGDERGFFARVFCAQEFGDFGLVTNFVQFNTSLSVDPGTLRGMHYQARTSAETKVVRCIKGAIFDVAIDLRKTSPSFGKFTAARLDDINRDMLYVPKGCAHGFLTLEPNTEVLYFVDNFYHPGDERGVRFDDPTFAVPWPSFPSQISDKDRSWPNFDAANSIDEEWLKH